MKEKTYRLTKFVLIILITIGLLILFYGEIHKDDCCSPCKKDEKNCPAQCGKCKTIDSFKRYIKEIKED